MTKEDLSPHTREVQQEEIGAKKELNKIPCPFIIQKRKKKTLRIKGELL
jgi:hypothetical protein